MASRAHDAPSWSQLGPTWPNRSASRFVEAGGLRWHLQEMGPSDESAATGCPVVLLVHGTAAATHSWRGLLPLLAARHRVLAPDLPGHGFTDAPPRRRMTLPGMAASLQRLLAALEVAPDLVVGHSAGAAILARMALDGALAPAGLVSLNGALRPFPGMAGQLFPPLARLLFANPLTPRLFALGGRDRARIERLIRGTGSLLDAEGLAHYRALMSTPGHVGSALAMMAQWDLEALWHDLPGLAVPLLLVVGERDRAIAPQDARRVAARVPGARVVGLAGVGHLAHEEQPEAVAAEIGAFAEDVGLAAADAAPGDGQQPAAF